MQKQINTQTREGEKVVSARDLHEFLGVKERFSAWIQRMFEDTFLENEDYFLTPKIRKQKGSGGHNATDYLLTLDTAKEIGMMQKSAKGREIRNYFITLEKSFYKIAASVSDKALATQTELLRLKNRKREIQQKVAPELREIKQITRQMGKLQDATFGQLGLFGSETYDLEISNYSLLVNKFVNL